MEDEGSADAAGTRKLKQRRCNCIYLACYKQSLYIALLLRHVYICVGCEAARASMQPRPFISVTDVLISAEDR